MRRTTDFPAARTQQSPDQGSPYHEGEQALQARAGMRDQVEKVGRKVIRDFMPDQHRELFEKLPFLIVGSLDGVQRPWASILAGRPGFIGSPDSKTLTVRARAAYGDPLAGNLAEGAPVGLLGIELETRRRNRMNGTVTQRTDGGFTVQVAQSFGNCPKYIQARRHVFTRDPGSTGAQSAVHREGVVLSAEAAALVRRSDAFFIATAALHAGAPQPDVSHRGGKQGFVRVTEEEGRTVLIAPDFRGNFHFATLGNLAVYPRAGLLFVDFATGDLLLLTGEADVLWEGAELQAFAGAERLLRFRLEAGLRIADAVPLRWSPPVEEPHLAGTGSWERQS